ncbi:MAG: ABC transporter permease [Bacteroidetes bacterium]|nr:ABC transporter permease [Bacteroidota bacterium]
MNYRVLLARRYLFSPRRWRFISVLSGISVLGVAIGVTMLIVVLSVFNGFYTLVRDLLLSFDPHVRLVPAQGPYLREVARWRALAEGAPYARQVSPYIEGKALLLYGSGPGRVVLVRGLDPRALPPGLTPDLGPGLRAPASAGLLTPSGAPPPVLVGLSLASEMGFFRGDTVHLLGTAGVAEALARLGLPAPRPFRVMGLYEIYRVFDQAHVFTSLEAARSLLRFPEGAASGIEMRLSDPDRAREVQRWLEARLGDAPVRVETWYDLQRTLYEVMALEKWASYLILSLIIGVAALNILGSLTLLVLEKRREIGLLMALGASARDVRRLFLYAGLWIGIIGGICGLVLGWGLCELQARYGLVRLKGADAFLVEAYPVRVEWFDVGVILLGAWLLCLLAAWYPAWRAGRIWPAEALRYE